MVQKSFVQQLMRQGPVPQVRHPLVLVAVTFMTSILIYAFCSLKIPIMTTEDGLDWLEESIPFLPFFLEEPYSISDDITSYDWWDPQSPDPNPNRLFNLPPATSTAASPVEPTNTPYQPELSKKRKRQQQSINTGRKNSSKLTANNSNNNKEARWAEQLLNPLATAIETSNLSRVRHLLYVLQELSSPTGDANHRLAYHGLRALTRYLSNSFTGNDHNPNPPPTYGTTEPKQFRASLIKFHEISPWFAFPNSLANASILQTLTLDSTNNQRLRTLHVVDIGVSHGIQWPTLLEALTRRNNGAPPLVKLSIASNAIPSPPGPFSSPPAGYDFPSHLLRYANSIDLNLKIDRISNITSINCNKNEDEILTICAQFRASHLRSDYRTSFFKSIKDLDPDLVILTEIDGGSCDDVTAGFSTKAEILWSFLDSTNAAFKGRDCVERRIVEGEMARVLEMRELVEGRERWRERMLGLGFEELGFCEEAIDGGKSLLRKYDGNWEMKTTAAAVGLWWKGAPVSFCSIWKTVKRG